MEEQKKKEKELKRAEQERRKSTTLNLKSMMHRMNQGKNPDDTSMGEETTEDEYEYQEGGWTDDVELEDDLIEEAGLPEEEMQMNDGEVQETNGNGEIRKANIGGDNDFIKASLLPRTTTATNNRTNTIIGLEGTSLTNRKEDDETELTQTNLRNNGIAQTKPGTAQIKSGNGRNLGIASGKHAKDTMMATEVLRVGPSGGGIQGSPEAPTQKFYKYNVQLTFTKVLETGSSNAKKGIYTVPYHFKQVVKQWHAFSPAITLHPYNTSGISITNVDQLPDDEIEEYITYYHNHRVTAGGQLTGMCCIEAPFTWYQLKDEKKSLFKWLRDKGVYMKYVSFKADQVSAAGWLYGLPPDVLRLDETKQELRQRLGDKLPPDLEFQLGTRMLSVTDKITRNRFTFKGIAVECERNRVKELQEALYKMGSPKEARFQYGITGKAMFVPFIESEVWPNKNLLGMAKAHVQEMSKLGQLFLQNVQDIDQLLTWEEGDKESLRLMLTNCTTIDGYHMIHSVHKTNREGMIAVLYYKEFKNEANNCFQDIHSILENQLLEESKSKLAIEGKRIIMTGSRTQVESSTASREYASYVDAILEGMNPQGGEEYEEEPILSSPPRKKQAQRKTPPRLSYSQIAQSKKGKEDKQVKRNRVEEPDPADDNTDDSSTVDQLKTTPIIENLQQRLNAMQAQFEDQFGKVVGTDMEATQLLIEANNKKIQQQSEEFFEQKFQELSVNLSKEIQRSNDLILDRFVAVTAQQNTNLLSLQEAIKYELQKVYANMANIQSGKPMENFSPQTLGIVATPGNVPQASDGGQ